VARCSRDGGIVPATNYNPPVAVASLGDSPLCTRGPFSFVRATTLFAGGVYASIQSFQEVAWNGALTLYKPPLCKGRWHSLLWRRDCPCY